MIVLLQEVRGYDPQAIHKKKLVNVILYTFRQSISRPSLNKLMYTTLNEISECTNN